MPKLRYPLTNDTLFKVLFVKHQKLLKRLVAELLGLRLGSIRKFTITNPEVPPDAIDEKFCRLDVNMIVNGRRVDLEVQVEDEGDFPERSLYYWAREYSSALGGGGMYSELPQTIVVGILAFQLFDCAEFHSEFRPLEVTRHTQLTDRQVLHYFELPKLPTRFDPADGLMLWLNLFKAKTEEDLKKIEALEVPVMKEAITAYRAVSGTAEFRELERLRSRARHNEASALGHAHDKGMAKGMKKGKAEGLAEGIEKGKAEGFVEGLLGVARTALSQNMSARDIAKLTGLSLAEIKRMAGTGAGG